MRNRTKEFGWMDGPERGAPDYRFLFATGMGASPPPLVSQVLDQVGRRIGNGSFREFLELARSESVYNDYQSGDL